MYHYIEMTITIKKGDFTVEANAGVNQVGAQILLENLTTLT